MTTQCGNCEYLRPTDKGGYAWCPQYPGHWNQEYQRYTGGYCHLESPGCEFFKQKAGD